MDTSNGNYNQQELTSSPNETFPIAATPMSASITPPYSSITSCDAFGLPHCKFDVWRAWLLAGVSALVAASNVKTTILLICVRVHDHRMLGLARTGSESVTAKASTVHTADLFCLKLTCVNALFAALRLCMTYCSFPFTKCKVTQVTVLRFTYRCVSIMYKVSVRYKLFNYNTNYFITRIVTEPSYSNWVKSTVLVQYIVWVKDIVLYKTRNIRFVSWIENNCACWYLTLVTLALCFWTFSHIYS